MMNRTSISTLILIVALLHAGRAQSAEPAAKSYYLIGNSLTWDTLPALLDGDVQWHVDCGTSLTHTHANPDKPCVDTSALWPSALREKQYDVVSVQPHEGDRLEQVVQVISEWMKLQPQAVFVIHSGWASHANRAEEFASFDPGGAMQHSPAYFRELLSQLRALHPGRELRQTRAIHLLQKLAEDIAEKQAPFADVSDLHRDFIHMKHESGKYLMHNAMRHALGQPMSNAGFESMDPKVKQYLDGLLSLLTIPDSDQKLLSEILSISESVDRKALLMNISSMELKSQLRAVLPELAERAALRRRSEKLAAEVNELGGKLFFEPTGPQWLYLAVEEGATSIYETPAVIDLYNGNNPLKGRGGKNELVTNAWLQQLTEFTTLKKLSLANCKIDDESLLPVGKLVGLRELNLTLTPITDAGLAHLSKLTELRALGLASTQCTGTGFAHLKELTQLENVNFHYTPLNDAGLLAISQVGISGRLWFAHTHFTDEGAESLANLKELRQCGIGSKEQASSGEAVAALTTLPLEELYLLDNQATSAGIAHASQISTLRLLDVSYGPKVDDAALEAIARMPKLETFKLGSAIVTDEGLQALADSKSLKKVILERLKHVTEAGVDRLRQARPELKIELR